MGLKNLFSKFLIVRKKSELLENDILFEKEISNIIGRKIKDIAIYREAFSLKISGSNSKKNYERLEFLGDSVLGTIISSYLFDKYPNANEGFLTQMKSKIVNRKNLNLLGADLGLEQLILTECNTSLSENITGNLLEAFVGAIFLDFGYDKCQSIVLDKILPPEDIKKLENKIISYKGLLLEWSQKKKVAIRYETFEEDCINKTNNFRCIVWLADNKIANASESSKKKAEEKAAQRAFYMLNKKQQIIEKQKTLS